MHLLILYIIYNIYIANSIYDVSENSSSAIVTQITLGVGPLMCSVAVHS